LIKYSHPEERAEVCFHIFKFGQDSQRTNDFVEGKNFVTIGSSILELPEETINDFCNKNQIKSQTKIDLSKMSLILFLVLFKNLYKRNLSHPMFEWFEQLSSSFNGLENAEIPAERTPSVIDSPTKIGQLKDRSSSAFSKKEVIKSF